MKTTNNDVNLERSITANLNSRKVSLETQILALKEFCDIFDPFQPITEESKTKLSLFGIEDHSDPYKLTNLLVTKIEDSIEELQKIEDNPKLIQ